MTSDFCELVHAIHKERMNAVYEEYEEKQRLGEDIYTMFCIWLYSEGRDKEIHNAQEFANYLSDNGKKLTQQQRIHLAKKYFGYKCKEEDL